jgi:hypothetical protein
MSEILDYAVNPFLTDGKDFANVLSSIEYDRDVISKFSNLTHSYKNVYAPLSFLLKPISKMCQKEVAKLDGQIKILQEICAIYKAVGDVMQKGPTSQEERVLAKTTLGILTTRLDEHEGQMQHWHPTLKDKLLNRHQARDNAKRLISEIY